jgi:predicted permease
MRWMVRTRSLLRNLFQREQLDQDLDHEVSSYLELLADQKISRGMSREKALREARLELGGAAQVKDEVRRTRFGAWLATLWQDLRHGARILRNTPGFTAIAVLIFSIGIGANTAIFSMVNGLVLRQLPVEKPQQLTFLRPHPAHWGNGFSFPDSEDIRNQSSEAFSDVAIVDMFHMDGLRYAGQTHTMWADYVTTNFFSVMGVRPALGSLLAPESKLEGSEPVLVLGYSFWKTRFAADPNIIGQKVSVNGRAVTVIGVAAQGFFGAFNLTDVQGYMPLGFLESEPAATRKLNDREQYTGLVIARLKPDIDMNHAQAVLSVVANRLAAQYPKIHKDMMIRAVALGNGFAANSTGENPMPLIATLFLILAALVLVLAAANLVNLLLVRALARNREMAVRSALGAARARLIRQLLTETMLLALLGCCGGVLLGWSGARAVRSISFQTDLPVRLDFSLDWRVFSYALAAAVAVVLVAGLAPAWRASAVDLNNVLREGARNINLSPGRQRLRSLLAVSQVAGSLMLLIVSGLFVRSLGNVQRTDLGFDPNHVMNFTMDVHHAGYSEARAREFYDQLLARTRSLPMAESASLSQVVPMGFYDKGAALAIPGYQQPAGQRAPYAAYNAVSPDYFKVLRIPVVAGRTILESDTASAARVAVINQAMAERYWPGANPIGRQFKRDDDPGHIWQVVGVFKNARLQDLTSPIGPFFFVPIAQDYASLQTLQVRTSGIPSTMAAPVLAVIRSLEPALPVGDVQSMNQVLDGLNGLLLFRLGAGVAGALGILGLVLATVGVYGVVAYSTAQRTREIGIRMALGALPSQVVIPMLRRGLFVVSAGLALGQLAAAGIAKLVGGFLVGVSPTDPLTYALVSSALAAIALLASFVPARRATRVDPTVALRHE